MATAHGSASDDADRDTGRWFRQSRAFAQRYARELFRNKAVLFWSVAFPVAFYLLTITVFIDTTEVPGEVLPYVKAGTAVSYGMFGAIIASLNSFGQQLAADFEADRYTQYRSLPLTPSADLAGRMAAGVALSAVAFLAVIGAAVATGAAFGVRSAVSVPLVLVAFVSFTLVWMALAVGIAVLVEDTRYASIITISIALGSYFLTGFNGTNPENFQGPTEALNWLPNTAATRQVNEQIVVPPADLADGGATLGVPDPLPALGQLTLYGLVAALLAVLVMRYVVYGGGRA
jgi:ABC-2 type transport system permease protein